MFKAGLAGHLVDDGVLSENQASEAWRQARAQNLSLVSYLVKNQLAASSVIVDCCARHFGLPVFRLEKFHPPETELKILDEELVRRYRVIPLGKQGQLLRIGIADPSDRSALDALTFHTGLILELLLVSEDSLNHFIDQHYNQIKNESLQVKTLQKIVPEETRIRAMENSASYEEPIIQFVDHMIHHAQQQGASDLHIEPYEHFTRIRYRQDGLLYEIAQIEQHLASRVITRLKVLADLDIAERRLPQDGRFQIRTRHRKTIDLRLSSCPTLHGEKVVLRILDQNRHSLSLDGLGLSPAQQQLFQKKISQPQGLILVTGPTGSGKTITLYTALDYLNQREKNIVTVEDPVEIQLEGINQVPIQPKAGLDYATVLRAFLRQDPDIIMVGEIRDRETAEIALQAAQTGHLVLSTLHTNSAVETITRLISMGIAAYQLSQALTLIVAQRLLRKLCPECKAYGCRHCRQGYSGRTAIFECLDMNDQLIQAASSGMEPANLLQTARASGFVTLHDAGLDIIHQGKTSLAELNRVLRR